MFASLSEVAELQQIDEEEEEEQPQDEEIQDQDGENKSPEKEATSSTADTKADLPIQSTTTTADSVSAPNPFEPRAPNTTERASSPPKRKHEGPDVPLNPKRQEVDNSGVAVLPAAVPQAKEDVEESDSDDDASVHLNMELEDDDEDEDEDE